MPTRLVLVLELDGGTPAEVQAYGEQVAASIRRAAERGDSASVEWRAAQFVEVRIVEHGEPFWNAPRPRVEVRPLPPAGDELPSVHAAAVAAEQPHAMTNAAGDWFYPDNPDDAGWFMYAHGAWYANTGGEQWG